MPTPRSRRAGYGPLLEALEDRRLLSTVTVTSLGDSGAGSLRAVIAAADNGDTIVFSPTLFSSTSTTRPPKKGQQTGDPTITLKNIQLTLTKDLTIRGPGADQLTISTRSGTAFRVFEVAQGATVTLSGMTITNGIARYGGGIYNGGTLTLADSSIHGNQAVFGGGIYNAGGTVNIANSILLDNHGEDGGGIYNAGGGLLQIINSKVTGNGVQFGYVGSGRGGGIYNSPGGTVTISSNSKVHGNTAVMSWEVGLFGNDIYNYGTVYMDNTSTYGSLYGNAPILI